MAFNKENNSLVDFARLSFGNIIEWYDFSLYVYFADHIASSFFPNSNHYVSMLLVFSTFFLGSIVRPFGGILVGWLGDKFDLETMINICIISMGISTFAVAFLPDFKTIGILAPAMLIILRIIQGISVGGQFPGLITLSVQDYKCNKGFAVGIVFSVSTLGFLLASLIGFIISFIVKENSQLIWRIPFGFSGILFLIYLVLNKGRDKIENESEDSNKKEDNVFISIIKQWRSVIAVVCLTTMAASLYFLIFTYMLDYLVDNLNVSSHTAFLLNCIILFIACFLYPVAGYLSDKFNNIRIYYLSVVCLSALSFPLIKMLQTKDIFWMLTSLLLFTVFMTLIQGAISPLFADTFSEEWQTTGCALSYSIGNGVSGGVPLTAAFMIHSFPGNGLLLFTLALLVVGSFGMLIINYLQRKRKIDISVEALHEECTYR